MVTYYVKIIKESYLAIIALSNDTMLLSLSDTECSITELKDKSSKLYGATFPMVPCDQCETSSGNGRGQKNRLSVTYARHGWWLFKSHKKLRLRIAEPEYVHLIQV